MVTHGQCVVRLEFTSAFDMIDLALTVGDHVAREIGFDEESIHWIGVAVRESIINAIKHGNRHYATKHVFVEFETELREDGRGLMTSVRDEGEGFDPEALDDPLAPENLLKSNGRGIFLIRSFMDDVRLRRLPEGGMEIRMIKRIR